jgi:transposase
MEPSSNNPRAAYTSDVSDAEWDFCLTYLGLMKEDAPQGDYPLRELFNALRYIVRCGCQWRMMPHDLLPWQNVYQKAQRWMKACCFEAMAHDLRELSRVAKGRKAHPTAAIMDGRTLQSSPESGGRAGFDGYKRRKGRKVHIAVNALGHLPAVKVTAANEQERAQVGEVSVQIQQATGENVQLAYVDQGYTGGKPARQAQEHGIKLSEARNGFMLLPKRWVVERSFGWVARFKRLSKDYERLASTLTGKHWLAFAILMLTSLFGKS